MTLRHERDNVFRVNIGGRLRKRELDDVQQSVAAEIARLGTIRLLIVLSGFEGWEDEDNWRDLSFYVRHGDQIERIALVGDERWRSQALMFTAADLRKGAVAFFPTADEGGARSWLAE